MTNSNDVFKIDTPENVTFDYEVAGIGSRFLAALVDTALIVVLQALVIGLLLLLAFLLRDTGVTFDSMTAWMAAVLGLISFIFLWGYYIFFEILWNGQSPGKRWVGVRVIRMDGTPITVSESVIRNLVRIIDFLPTAYGVGVVTMFINANSRRVGDFAAGTIVVHDREAKGLGELSPVRMSTITVPGAKNHLPDGFPIERVSEYELQIIEEFLARRSELSNRGELAYHILGSIIMRLGISRDSLSTSNSEEILAAIYKACRTEETK